MISSSTEHLIENQCQTTAKASNSGDGCISSRVPFPFKLCLLLCTFGIVVIYYSMNSANWENVYEKNATFFWHSDQQPFSPPQKDDILTLAEAMNIQVQNDWTKMCAGTVNKKEMDRLFEPQPEKERKYVLANWSWLCGGLGNQMWRFASLYGIGRPYGRRPIYTEDQRCLKDHGPHESEGENEMANLFPVLAAHLKYIKLIPEQTIILDGFTEGCCKYDDPQRIKFSRLKQKYVQIKSYYFQSYKFFESRRHEIRQIFQFSSNVCSTIKNYAQQLFGNDTAHKVCVHTRIEDFKNFGFESKREFAEKGIEFVHDKLKKKFANISIVLMGAEKHFLANLTIDRTKFNGVYLPKPMSRGNDLAFATIACDSLLITASSSTFSWWMGYLMPDDANIFYDSNLDHTPYVRENFLPEWTPIKLENGTIILD